MADKEGAFTQISIWLASNPEQVGAADRDETWEQKDLREDSKYAVAFNGK